jgi:ubiquinone/menaquinone biosynthesis C-methylase UbiE
MKRALSGISSLLSPFTAIALATALCVPLLLSEETPKEKSVKPGINSKFLDPNLDVKEWIGRFEVESREVYNCREDIVQALELKPGMAIADIGAGTGLYLEPFAKAVGDKGKVYAVDISEAFVKALKERSKELKLNQVEVVLCKEDSVSLKKESIDVAFVCDTYHHFEYPASTLASIHEALKPGGRLVVIDFERIPGVSREWTLGHVRAGKEVFTSEIKAANFEPNKEVTIEGFKENYFLVFRKPSGTPNSSKSPAQPAP